MKNTSELMAKLKNLAGQAGQSIRERLELVETILRDVEYVTASFGDENKALETLEADCFGDLCGARSLPELLAIYREFPESEWKRFKWNLTRLLAEWDSKREKRTHVVENPPIKNAVYQDLHQRFEEQGVMLKGAKKELDKYKERTQELERENLILKTRVEELERQLERIFSKHLMAVA